VTGQAPGRRAADPGRGASQRILRDEAELVAGVMKIRFFPLVVHAAEGATITDPDGRGYLDFTAAGGVAQLGYRHPEIARAVAAELATTWSTMHCCYVSEPTVELARALSALLPGPRKVWFGTTGSDANDCLATLVPLATGRQRMASFAGSYHGQTAGSAALSGHPAQRARSGGSVTTVPYPYPYRCPHGPCPADECSLGCVRDIEAALDASDEPLGALIMESVQSDGGELVPPRNVFPALRRACDQRGAWLLFDEVKVGLGRTGRMFGFEHGDVVPDAVSLGKPLGGGLPLSAVIARPELFEPDVLVLSTLGGSPVPARAGLATLDVIQRDSLVARAAVMGQRLLEGLRDLQRDHPLIGDVRGRGLIAGVELVEDRATRQPARRKTHAVVYRCFELGLVTIYAGVYGNVIELTPPLVLTDQELALGLGILDQALGDVEGGRFDHSKLAGYAGW
jgi:4-aminobutyrate aminotransferase